VVVRGAVGFDVDEEAAMRGGGVSHHSSGKLDSV
jgi:hypothetical protein